MRSRILLRRSALVVFIVVRAHGAGQDFICWFQEAMIEILCEFFIACEVNFGGGFPRQMLEIVLGFVFFGVTPNLDGNQQFPSRLLERGWLIGIKHQIILLAASPFKL
ncbi:MAG: hypothetical protein HQM08_26150 [Candidatus Riflebacteria bacterium]|nr:hypothetical protein [Candidatus Riflebacteria bacterium]